MTDQNDETKKATIQADHKSVAVGSIAVGGSTGDINIHAGDIGYSVEEVSVLITQITSTFQPKPFHGRSPYKGLDVFDEEDAELFFGRESLVDDLVGRVKGSRTVFVTGPSGSGKSSLVRAGLIPALKQGGIRNSERWLYETMKPGRDPIGELGRVASSLAGSTNAEDEIRAKAMADETIFARWCEIALKDSREKRAVIFIDQFEEVFTQINKEERLAFLNLLTHAATVDKGRVIILFSMRSDFVSNCAIYPQLNALLSQQFIQIGAMQPEELVSAIAQPALRVGLRIDPDLVAQIINEMRGEPGALPLMQFALKDLFDSQQEKGGIIALTLSDYLERGGIHKALERHADHAFARLSENEQELAHSIFGGLIQIGRGTQDTRRIAPFDELIQASSNETEVQAVIQKLADARLITTDEKDSSKYTITHEKLIDAWPWLKKLVNENRDVIALQNEIASDAKEWEDHRRDASYLYSGARLVNANEQLKSNRLMLSGTAYEYITAAQMRQRRGQIALFGSIAIIFALLVIAVVNFANLTKEAQKQANIAQAASTRAVAQEATAQANAEQAERQAQIALARQLVTEAQAISGVGEAPQTARALLAVLSLQIFPSFEATRIIQNSLLPAPIARMDHGWLVSSLAFSKDGKYVASAGSNYIRVWEAATGNEIARMTHDGWVSSIAFSPDGSYTLLSSGDRTIRVWDVMMGEELASMTHEGLGSTNFNFDGKYIVSGGLDNTARVWEAATGQEVARMTHDDFVNSVAFSPDGKYVVSGSGDRTVRIWETMTGIEIARINHNATVRFASFSPRGEYVMSYSRDQILHRLRVSTGQELPQLPYPSQLTFIAYSPDGNYIVSVDEDSIVRVRDAVEGVEIARMTHEANFDSIAFSPDGRYIVSGGCESPNNFSACTKGSARVWEIATGREIAHMTCDEVVSSVAFSPDGKYVVSGSDDYAVIVWKLAAIQEIAHKEHNNWVRTVGFSPNTRYVVSADNYTAQVWESSTGKEIFSIAHSFLVRSVPFSPNNKYVVSVDDNIAHVWDFLTGKEIASMTHDSWVSSIAFSPDGKYVVSASADKTARVWKTMTGTEIARVTHEDGVSDVAFSPDGKYVVSASDNSARLWEAMTGKEVARMLHDNNVRFVAFSSDGKYILSLSCAQRDAANRTCIRGRAYVWEALTGKEIARITHDQDITSLAFSPDGKYIVSGSYDYTVRVWDAMTGMEITRMNYKVIVNSVAFSPNSKYVVSAGGDSARMWDAMTGKEITSMSNDIGVYAVAFSPDGKYIVSGGCDKQGLDKRGTVCSLGNARVWVWQPADIIANTCSRMNRNLTRVEWEDYIGDARAYQAVCPNLPIEAELTPTP